MDWIAQITIDMMYENGYSYKTCVVYTRIKAFLAYGWKIQWLAVAIHVPTNGTTQNELCMYNWFRKKRYYRIAQFGIVFHYPCSFSVCRWVASWCDWAQPNSMIRVFVCVCVCSSFPMCCRYLQPLFPHYIRFIVFGISPSNSPTMEIRINL